MPQNFIRKLLNNAGFEILRFPYSYLKSRATLIKHFEITTLLDVGANIGQYAIQMRRIGYTGRIISFEPMSHEYKALEKAAKNDQNWQTYQIALGDADTKLQIGITPNSQSSSLVPLVDQNKLTDINLRAVRTETVSVKRLDTVFAELTIPNTSNIYLKMDVQGFEKNVLDGASETLDFIKGIQIELCLEQIYENTLLFDEMKALLASKGFRLHSLEPGYAHPSTGKMLEVDGVFFRD